MAWTTCVYPHPQTGALCDNVTLQRLDKIIAGTTVSCGCLGLAIYMRWREYEASGICPERCAEIYDAAQATSGRKALCRAFPDLQSATLTIVIKQEHERRAVPVGRVDSQTAAGDLAWKQERDDCFLHALRKLREEVEDVGWWPRRRKAVFNSQELTFFKDGDFTGDIMRIYWWAESQISLDSEMVSLRSWLRETINATRVDRLEVRRQYARQRMLAKQPGRPAKTDQTVAAA